MTFARKTPKPGHALATIKLRAGALDFSFTGELPEAVAAAIAYAVCSRTGIMPEAVGANLVEGIGNGTDARRAATTTPENPTK